LFGWAMSQGISGDTLWNETYWTEPWQTWGAIGNSIPLFAVLLLVSLMIVRPKDGRSRWQSLPVLFALSALIHIAGDFPVHNGDAHIHFWPLSDWRFHSPVSYWDSAHFADIIAPLEAILGIFLAVILFRRFNHLFIRLVLSTFVLAYIAVPVFFILQLA
ncbi:MAG: hypothetical protein AAFX02_07495, partial [Pseudomonadota bacterium]